MTFVLHGLDGWTTDQLFAEVLRRSGGDDRALRLRQGRTEIEGTPFAVLDEHLPQLHRALAALMAESVARTQAAGASMVVEDDGNVEEDWQRFFL